MLSLGSILLRFTRRLMVSLGLRYRLVWLWIDNRFYTVVDSGCANSDNVNY